VKSLAVSNGSGPSVAELGLESETLEEQELGRIDDTSSSAAFVPEASEGFVSSPYVEQLTRRALTYLDIGYPVHLAGFAGTGKTTVAFHIAAKRGRPVILIHGDDEFAGSDLIGKDVGYRKSKLIDNYIHSVLRAEENLRVLWMENRLTTACRDGYTLIYDEFNRSRPEANNVLLSVLEERMLSLPALGKLQGGYLEVHPQFRAIFTSNPEEYAGVHSTPDALLDRLITMNLGHYDRETEIRIAMARSGVGRQDAQTIVDVVRELRNVGVNNRRPTIRASIAVANILVHHGAHAHLDDEYFLWACRDVFNLETAKVSCSGESLMPHKVEEAVRRVCRGRKARKQEGGDVK